MTAHTILLVQPKPAPESKTYSDYETVKDCLEGLCKIFEEHLKRANPGKPQITYDIAQLFDFIDQLTDLCCLVFNHTKEAYVPHNKEWLKERVYQMMLKSAAQ